jgi:DNA-binding response OmpR family regulator
MITTIAPMILKIPYMANSSSFPTVLSTDYADLMPADANRAWHVRCSFGFKLGADDFIAKPFSVAELAARLEMALRRAAPRTTTAAPTASGSWRIGELVIDTARCQVTVDGATVHLTPTECRLLGILASRPDMVRSRPELANLVWGYYDPDIGRSLDVHMRRLRAKLTAGAASVPRLVTRRGFGYELVQAPRRDGTSAMEA